MIDYFKSLKWGMLLMGIVTLAGGILIAMDPNNSITTIIRFVGGIIAAGGLLSILGYMLEKKGGVSTFFDIIVGVVMLAIGLVLFIRPTTFELFINYIFAIILGVHGLNNIIEAFRSIHYKDKKWLTTLLMGLICIGFAVLIYFNPFDTANTLIFIIGIALIVDGILLVLIALRSGMVVHRFHKLEAAAEAAATAAGNALGEVEVEIHTKPDGGNQVLTQPAAAAASAFAAQTTTGTNAASATSSFGDAIPAYLPEESFQASADAMMQELKKKADSLASEADDNWQPANAYTPVTETPVLTTPAPKFDPDTGAPLTQAAVAIETPAPEAPAVETPAPKFDPDTGAPLTGEPAEAPAAEVPTAEDPAAVTTEEKDPETLFDVEEKADQAGKAASIAAIPSLFGGKDPIELAREKTADPFAVKEEVAAEVTETAEAVEQTETDSETAADEEEKPSIWKRLFS
ncbi:MAG: DUF308 domain-containing protein [Firmicutes bacterium]|nr:DUF308 domain-containing protein [Bacillota bacterium]